MMADEQRNMVYVNADQTQLQVEAFSHIKKDLYLSKLFCWIEQADTKKVIKFYNTFPHLINQLYTPNHWNPLMYAVRYGNIQLIQYFFEKKMSKQIKGIYNQVSIIHAAVYSTDVSILRYVLNNIQKSANPTNCQTSPLKISMKTGNPKMVQLLISKGAYYTFNDVYNNLTLKQNFAQQTNKYIALDTNKDISNALVVQDLTIKDCPIKETLRWARVRQAMYMRHYAKKMMQMKKQHDAQTPMEQEFLIKQEQQPIVHFDHQQQQKMDQQKELKVLQSQSTAKKLHQTKNSIKYLDQRHKFYDLSQILLNDDYYQNILKVLVGKGDSILVKNDPVNENQQRQLHRQQQSQKDLNKEKQPVKK